MAQAQAARDPNAYFVPHHSRWPLFASVALFVTMGGLASWFNEASYGKATFFVGIAGMIVILFKWFADVILESVSGYYNKQVDGSFRVGMVWRSEEHTSELQSLMRISYAVFCLKKKNVK